MGRLLDENSRSLGVVPLRHPQSLRDSAVEQLAEMGAHDPRGT